MGYKTVSTAVRNIEYAHTWYPHSNRRAVIVVPYEYLKFELGIDLMGDLTPELADRIETELSIRGQIPYNTQVKYMQIDYKRQTVRIYVINPDFQIVAEGVEAPETIIPL